MKQNAHTSREESSTFCSRSRNDNDPLFVRIAYAYRPLKLFTTNAIFIQDNTVHVNTLLVHIFALFTKTETSVSRRFRYHFVSVTNVVDEIDACN
jgi:hypothetical protein